MKHLAFLIAIAPLVAFADLTQIDQSLQALTGAYQRAGGSPKALKQLRCFLKQHGSSSFRPKIVSGELGIRCNSQRVLQINNEAYVALIDYTETSNLGRFFIFDLKNRRLQVIRVAHGRFEDTPAKNDRVMYNPKRNSVLKAVHFSNRLGSNASAGGFYITGFQYKGMWGDSLVLHGLEKDFNDNSCERATVIHKSENVTGFGVEAMSSGCPMVAPNELPAVLRNLREGTALYLYTPVEASVSESTCGRGLTKF